ncbi:hypothetical protein HK107_02030 [Parvularcula sp. ZS-1/3]|uniref:Phage holin family protein n=1 Tax=Parvularcula mediterranea TaxID=2732508 RepID=A0A7Y3RKL8_9PROT|nr:hypothetical protein [Parvularcula mediterranea]NNU15102.1 hypothetical protein [Parvularcula mediterranea]
MGIPGVKPKKLRRLAVRVEVGILAGTVGLTGVALLIAAAVVWLNQTMSLLAALAYVGMGLILVAGCSVLIQRIWEMNQKAPQPDEPDEDDENPLERAVEVATSGPLGMASSALVARQVRKAPITTAAGLAAIGLLMATRDRREQRKVEIDR